MKIFFLTTVLLTSLSLHADDEKVLRSMHANTQTEKQNQDYVIDDVPTAENFSDEKKKELYKDVGNKSIEEMMEKYPEVAPGQIKMMMRRK